MGYTSSLHQEAGLFRFLSYESLLLSLNREKEKEKIIRIQGSCIAFTLQNPLFDFASHCELPACSAWGREVSRVCSCLGLLWLPVPGAAICRGRRISGLSSFWAQHASNNGWLPSMCGSLHVTEDTPHLVRWKGTSGLMSASPERRWAPGQLNMQLRPGLSSFSLHSAFWDQLDPKAGSVLGNDMTGTIPGHVLTSCSRGERGCHSPHPEQSLGFLDLMQLQDSLKPVTGKLWECPDGLQVGAEKGQLPSK